MIFRRKLSMPALAVMAVITIYEVLGHLVAFVFAVSIALGTIVVLAGGCKGNVNPGSNSVRLISCFSVILVCFSLVHLWVIDNADRVLPRMADDTVTVQGKITDIRTKKKEGGDRTSMILRVYKVEGRTLDPAEKVLIDCPFDGERTVGDSIAATGRIKQPDPKRNPNTFDYRAYLRTKGIYVTMYAEDMVIVTSRSGGVFAGLYREKEDFLESLSTWAGEDEADIMRAILFGDKGRIDEDVEEVFRMNGTAHVLAVSGLHVGMVYGLILFLWNRLGGLLPGHGGGRRDWGFLTCVAIMLVTYAFLAGFAPSVVRAVIMILLHIFAGMTGRYYDLKSATLAVFIVSLVIDPLILFQSGFQMSFLAILSLSIVMPYLRGFLSGTILAGACIQTGLMPYMIYQFNWLSIPTVLINVPVIFLAGLIVPLGILSFAVCGLSDLISGLVGSTATVHVGCISGSIEQIMGKIISVLCDLMVYLNELCCIEGLTAIRVCSPPIWMVLLSYMSLVAFASESGRLMTKRSGNRAICYRAIAILIIAISIGNAVDDGYSKMDMVFVDVGQGDAMHLRVTDGLGLFGGSIPGVGSCNYLIDGGGDEDYEVGTKTLRPYLLKNGVRTIDGAFVSHLHTDHYTGICEIAQAGMVRKLYVYEANRMKLEKICSETGMDEDDIVFLKKGDRIILGKTLTGRTTAYMDVLWPEKKNDVEYRTMLENEEDENALSLILRPVVEGVSLLATGDLGEEGEKEILGAYVRPSTVVGGYTGINKGGWTGRTGAVDKTADHLCSDILKVGHHGSRYSTCNEFLDAVSPSLAVIQVSKGNTYGHPTPEVLKKLADRGIPTYRNDLQGAIGFSLSGGSIKEARTMIE